MLTIRCVCIRMYMCVCACVRVRVHMYMCVCVWVGGWVGVYMCVLIMMMHACLCVFGLIFVHMFVCFLCCSVCLPHLHTYTVHMCVYVCVHVVCSVLAISFFLCYLSNILQKCLASHESSGIDIIVALVMKDIDSKTEDDDLDIKSYMKLKVRMCPCLVCEQDCAYDTESVWCVSRTVLTTLRVCGV